MKEDMKNLLTEEQFLKIYSKICNFEDGEEALNYLKQVGIIQKSALEEAREFVNTANTKLNNLLELDYLNGMNETKDRYEQVISELQNKIKELEERG